MRVAVPLVMCCGGNGVGVTSIALLKGRSGVVMYHVLTVSNVMFY